jgi:hypothetical protein
MEEEEELRRLLPLVAQGVEVRTELKASHTSRLRPHTPVA